MNAGNEMDSLEGAAYGEKHVSFAEACRPEGGKQDAAGVHSTAANPHIVVPLSSIPESSGIVPTSSTTLDERHNNNRLISDDDAPSTGDSSARQSSKSFVSNAISAVKLKVNHPQQVSDKPTLYHRVLAWVGRVGWCGKAVVYALIGGLACQSANGKNQVDMSVSQRCQVSASPQGAFVLLGSTPEGPGANIAVLVIIMVALLAYIVWRFWEGLGGQGYDSSFSSKKNFFKFRISPLVSGFVYISYLAFLLQLTHAQAQGLPCEPGKESWPATWRHTTGGRVGLALLGFAFIIATIIQLQGVLLRQWHKDYREDLPRWFRRLVFAIGHLGFAGRAGAFLAMAVLFLKDASGVDDNTPHGSSMVANALQQLQDNRGLRALLMIFGVLLVCYGCFATLSSYARVFPTLPPSRRKVKPAQELVQQQEENENQQEGKEQLKQQRNHRNSKQGSDQILQDRQVRLGNGVDAAPAGPGGHGPPAGTVNLTGYPPRVAVVVGTVPDLSSPQVTNSQHSITINVQQ